MVLYGVGCDCAVLGLTDRALTLLKAAVAVGLRKKEWIEHEPDWAELRDHPRFVAGLREL